MLQLLLGNESWTSLACVCCMWDKLREVLLLLIHDAEIRIFLPDAEKSGINVGVLT